MCWPRSCTAPLTTRFLDDFELGEACSGYNQNYLRTTRALIKSSDERKIEIFKYLGQSGPMFGGSPDPLSSNPAPGRGNMTPSFPMCSSLAKFAQLPDWLLTGSTGGAFGQLASFAPAEYDCHSRAQQKIWEQVMRHGWAGKRLYTNAEGGRITNRFFPSFTEAPGADTLAGGTAETPGLRELKLFPYGTAQTRHGLIFRGRSYVDGNESILMDWRGLEAYPANVEIPRVLGYMPWVTKGPPSIEEYIEAIQ